MTLKHTHPLIDHIPLDEGKALTEVSFMKPRLCHILSLVLAIGPEPIIQLIGRSSAGSSVDQDRLELSQDDWEKLLNGLMTDERANAFYSFLGEFFCLPADKAKLLGLEDLIAIGKKVMDFFPDIAGQILDVSSGMSSTSSK